MLWQPISGTSIIITVIVTLEDDSGGVSTPCDKDYLLRLFLRKLKSLFLSEKPTRNASNPHRVCPCRRRPVPYLHALRSDRVTITTQSTVA